MRHHNNIRKFGRVRNQRKAFINSLAEALIVREKITTTETRAKELRPFVEKLITKGKQGTLAARRGIISTLGGRERLAKKVVEVLAPRYKGRAGGYIRITKIASRSADGRKKAVIEFVV